MRFLADMGVSIKVVEWLKAEGHDAKHLQDVGISRCHAGLDPAPSVLFLYFILSQKSSKEKTLGSRFRGDDRKEKRLCKDLARKGRNRSCGTGPL